MILEFQSKLFKTIGRIDPAQNCYFFVLSYKSRICQKIIYRFSFYENKSNDYYSLSLDLITNKKY